MPKTSAGLLPYRVLGGGAGLGGRAGQGGAIEVFLVHPGGPLWARKDAGAWSIAKGELEPGEDPQAAAVREFREETGLGVEGAAALHPLGSVVQAGGKEVHAFAVAVAGLDPAAVRSNTFALEWPPGSGRRQEFPEPDRAGWFPLEEAREKILKGQRPFLDRLVAFLEGPAGGARGA